MIRWLGSKDTTKDTYHSTPQGRCVVTPLRTSTKTGCTSNIDMDAFFASVEIRDNPGLKDKPVAVGGISGKRGIITAANYIARKYGLKVGMTSLEAQRRCPHVVFCL